MKIDKCLLVTLVMVLLMVGGKGKVEVGKGNMTENEERKKFECNRLRKNSWREAVQMAEIWTYLNVDGDRWGKVVRRGISDRMVKKASPEYQEKND